MGSVVTSSKMAERAYLQKMSSLRRFLRAKKCPKPLRKKVRLFYEHAHAQASAVDESRTRAAPSFLLPDQRRSARRPSSLLCLAGSSTLPPSALRTNYDLLDTNRDIAWQTAVYVGTKLFRGF